LSKTKKIKQKKENRDKTELAFVLKDPERIYLLYVVNDKISFNNLVNYFSYLFKKIIKR